MSDREEYVLIEWRGKEYHAFTEGNMQCGWCVFKSDCPQEIDDLCLEGEFRYWEEADGSDS